MKIAIIPARGGSTRVPLKNIREFAGIPILSRTLRILNECQLFDQIIVSTDSEKIAEVAIKTPGTQVSWRNSLLSGHDANIVDVMAEETLQSSMSIEDRVCCVYAPNPFLRTDAIKLGLQVLESQQRIDYVTPMTTYPFPVQRSLSFDQSKNSISMADPTYLLAHSQTLEPRFHETAQFWWAMAETWVKRKPMQMNMMGIYTPRWMTQDIDTLEDWDQAEIRWEILNKRTSYLNYEFSEANILTQDSFEEWGHLERFPG